MLSRPADVDDSGQGASRVLRIIPAAVSLIASAAFIIRAASSINGRRAYLLFDDAAISLNYARSFADGHGLVWVPGQHPVEGYSNLLWTLWMAVLELPHPADRLVGLEVMFSGAVILAANVHLITRIARRVAGPSQLVPLLCGLAAAVYYALTSWTLEGMETGLVALLYSGAILIALTACDPGTPSNRRQRLLLGCGSVLALAALTRDDTLVVAAVVGVFVFLRSGRRLVSVAITGAPVVLAVLGHLLFRLAYYGEPLPNTYYLKLGGVPLTSRLGRGLVVLAQNASLQLVVPVVLTVAFVWLATRERRPMPYGTGLLLGVLVAQALYVLYAGGDSYDQSYSDRFLVPVVPFLFILAVLGATALAASVGKSRRPILTCGVVILLADLFIATRALPVHVLLQPGAPLSWLMCNLACGIAVIGFGLANLFGRLPVGFLVCGLSLAAVVATDAVPITSWAQHRYGPLDAFAAAEGTALARSTPPTATVAVVGAGNIVFFDHRRAVDLLGYDDHFIATRTPHLAISTPGHEKWDYAYSIGKLRPDVVVGLFEPTPTDLRNMFRWGYREAHFFFGRLYYLPGWFNPKAFASVR